MRIKSLLNVAVVFSLMAVPMAYAQHGRGAGRPASPGMSGGLGGHASSHGSSAPSTGKNSSTAGHDNASVSTRLSTNTKLAGKLQSLLPAGTDLQQAADGFKNLGQFVAAVHVSNNLGIPFDQLKAKMTGDNAESLGKAIQELKPAADANAEAKKASKEANHDIDDSGK